MGRCEVCQNDYAKTFQVIIQDQTHEFDCFECAIHALAPSCAHCGCRVIGHGVEHAEVIYCSASCALQAGVTGVVDHV